MFRLIFMHSCPKIPEFLPPLRILIVSLGMSWNIRLFLRYHINIVKVIVFYKIRLLLLLCILLLLIVLVLLLLLLSLKHLFVFKAQLTVFISLVFFLQNTFRSLVMGFVYLPHWLLITLPPSVETAAVVINTIKYWTRMLPNARALRCLLKLIGLRA